MSNPVRQLSRSLSILAIGLMMLNASCVSSKKYDAAQSRIYDLRQDSLENHRQRTVMHKELLELQETYTAYQASCSEEKAALLSQLDSKSAALSEKDETLRERAEHLRQLQAQLDAQNASLESLRKKVSDALVNFDAEELTVQLKDGFIQVSLSDRLLFESASAKMDPKGQEALGKLAVVLKNNPDIEIMVVGHTDSLDIRTSRYRDNWDLSVDRAVSVVRLLTNEAGVQGRRIQAAGRSSYFPVAENDTKEGRALNRRTEILLTPNLKELFSIIETP